MRIPFISTVITSPFDDLLEHAEKVKECGWAFQQAIECQFSDRCERFEELREDIAALGRAAEGVKRRIREHIPKGSLLPVDKFQLFRYLREQDSVLEAVEHSLAWISFRLEPGVPNVLKKDFILFIDAVVDPIDEVSLMMKEARKYFKNHSRKHRVAVEEIIDNLRIQKRKAIELERTIISKAFNLDIDPITLFHVVRLVETVGTIAGHAEKAGGMMSAMVAK